MWKKLFKFQLSWIKWCHCLQCRTIVKSFSLVLQKKSLSFHRSLLETSMRKCVSVLSQKPTLIFYHKIWSKEAIVLYMFFLVNHICLNNCPLWHQALEFIELNCLHKHIKRLIRSSQNSIFAILVLSWSWSFFLWVLLRKKQFVLCHKIC